jgi:hypothetical protein
MVLLLAALIFAPVRKSIGSRGKILYAGIAQHFPFFAGAGQTTCCVHYGRSVNEEKACKKCLILNKRRVVCK